MTCFTPVDTNNCFSNVYVREIVRSELQKAAESLKGDSGPEGLSAYDVAVTNGFDGTKTDWLLSIKGDKGDSGRDGSYVQKAYKTYAGMITDKDNIPTNSNVVVNNDPDKDKNAYYTYDGTEFTKSDFDPQGILTTVDVRLNQAVESASDYFQSQVADTIATSIDNSTVAYTDAIEVTKGLLVEDAKLETKEALNTVIENGGLPAKPFATKVLMTASALVDGDYAMVTDDAVNNGLYVKTAGAWVKSAYDPLAQAKADATSKSATAKAEAIAAAALDATAKANAAITTADSNADSKIATALTKSSGTFDTLALLTASPLVDNAYALVANDTDLTKNGHYKKVSGVWTKVSYNPISTSKDYIDIKTKDLESLTYGGKNLFNPRALLEGGSYSESGGVNTGADRRRTEHIPCSAGDVVALSGIKALNNTYRPFLLFWSSMTTVISYIQLPKQTGVDSIVATAPVGTMYLTLNVNSVKVPQKLQIEKSSKPTSYEPYIKPEHSVPSAFTDEVKLVHSTKNLYDGEVITNRRAAGRTGFVVSSKSNDAITSYIPVEYGKTYTISGLNKDLIDYNNFGLNAYGFKSNLPIIQDVTNTTEIFDINYSSSITITITNIDTNYVAFPLTSDGFGTYDEAIKLSIQLEESDFATPYEPHLATARDYVEKAKAAANAKYQHNILKSRIYNTFVELDKVGAEPSTLVGFKKDISPNGVEYTLQSSNDNGSNNLFAQIPEIVGKKSILINLKKTLNDEITKGVLNVTRFDIPTGSVDNEGTLPSYAKGLYSKTCHTHPDIAYDSVGVAGFKYWMISSPLPSGNMGDAQWEDEDVFVSNDAKNWQRIRSLYEPSKSYTTEILRLPPHNLARANARQFAILPCPASGDTIEVSMPADNGAAAIDRQTVTLTGLPWKHDPAILIDGGYVYTYHTYHLPYAGRPSGTNRFIVCVRTNDGINWDVVRNDGSTMRITEENSRTLFTKDAQGRYNYMYYGYSRSNSNPTVIKWGEGDYELYYGSNYEYRVKGTTPYNFDFSNMIPMAGVGGHGNHPMVIRNGDTLYLINNKAVYSSTDRGVTLNKMPHYPLWLGGVSGSPYKKALCVGEAGKLIVFDVQVHSLVDYVQPSDGNSSRLVTERVMYSYEYPSFSDFLSKANNGLVDAYIDIFLCKINHNLGTRSFVSQLAISSVKNELNVGSKTQNIKIADMEFVAGDVLHAYVTLNSRNGAKIIFGGIYIN